MPNYKERIETALNIYSQVSSIECIETPFYEQYVVSFEGLPNWCKLKSHCEDLETMIGSSCRILIPMPGTTKIGIEIAKDKDKEVLCPENIFAQIASCGKSPLLLGVSPFNEPYVQDLGLAEGIAIIGQNPEEQTDYLYSFLYNFERLFHKEIEILYLNPNIWGDEELLKELNSVLFEVDLRRNLFKQNGAKNIDEYNLSQSVKMPRLVIAVDNFINMTSEAKDSCLECLETILIKTSGLGIYCFLSISVMGSNRMMGNLDFQTVFSKAIYMKISKDKSAYFLNCNDASFLEGGGDMLFYDGTYAHRFHAYDINTQVQETVESLFLPKGFTLERPSF